MNVLALGAHPDDLEMMCGGTLLKCRDRGDKIFVALTTSGNTGSNIIPTKEETAAIREAEQLRCSEHYGAETMFLRFDDEGLLDTPESRRAVLNAIRWANPDLILCNPTWDHSPDHGLTGKILTEVLLSVGGNLHPSDYPPIDKKPSVFFFESGAGGMDFPADIYVDITEQIDEKCQMILHHASQFAWVADTLGVEDYFATACRMRARYYGTRAEMPYAEGFVAHMILGYPPNYKLLP